MLFAHAYECVPLLALSGSRSTGTADYPQAHAMSQQPRHTCAVFVHPQLIWRILWFKLVEQFEQRGLRLWNRRTLSGRSVLTLEPSTETGDTQ